MEESAALARRLGLVLHTHLAETLEEDAYCRELYGCSPVEYLERVGWLAERRLVRALRPPLGPAEVERFAARDVGVAHCPTSNLRLGAGVAPVRELLDAGARVGLGVDGSASNERGDLFLEVKQALLVARGRGGGGGDERPRGASARHPGRRRAAPPRRHRLAGARQACRRRGLAHRRARARRRRGPRRRASSSPARTASTASSSAASRSCPRAGSPAQARRRSPASTASKPRGSPGDDRLHPRAGHRARRCPRPACASSSGAETSSSAPARPTTTGASGSSRGPSRARYRIVFHPLTPFFRRVELEVELGAGHHHVPLLLSSYACTSYRGS